MSPYWYTACLPASSVAQVRRGLSVGRVDCGPTRRKMFLMTGTAACGRGAAEARSLRHRQVQRKKRTFPPAQRCRYLLPGPTNSRRALAVAGLSTTPAAHAAATYFSAAAPPHTLQPSFHPMQVPTHNNSSVGSSSCTIAFIPKHRNTFRCINVCKCLQYENPSKEWQLCCCIVCASRP